MEENKKWLCAFLLFFMSSGLISTGVRFRFFWGIYLGAGVLQRALEMSASHAERTHLCILTTGMYSLCTAVVLTPASTLPFPNYTIQQKQQCVWSPCWPIHLQTHTNHAHSQLPPPDPNMHVPHPNHRHFPNRCLRCTLEDLHCLHLTLQLLITVMMGCYTCRRPDRTSIRGGRQGRIFSVMGNFKDLDHIHMRGNRALTGCQRFISLSLLFLIGPIDCLTALPCTYSRLDPTSHSLYIYLSLPVFQFCSVAERCVSSAELECWQRGFRYIKITAKTKKWLRYNAIIYAAFVSLCSSPARSLSAEINSRVSCRGYVIQ